MFSNEEAWTPWSRPQSIIAQRFSDELDDAFGLDSASELAYAVEDKKWVVSVQTAELLALEALLRVTEDLLKARQPSLEAADDASSDVESLCLDTDDFASEDKEFQLSDSDARSENSNSIQYADHDPMCSAGCLKKEGDEIKMAEEVHGGGTAFDQEVLGRQLDDVAEEAVEEAVDTQAKLTAQEMN